MSKPEALIERLIEKIIGDTGDAIEVAIEDAVSSVDFRLIVRKALGREGLLPPTSLSAAFPDSSSEEIPREGLSKKPSAEERRARDAELLAAVKKFHVASAQQIAEETGFDKRGVAVSLAFMAKAKKLRRDARGNYCSISSTK